MENNQDITTLNVPKDFTPTVLDNTKNSYWKDYDYWNTQEPLSIWLEVSAPKTKSWTFDTADTWITKVQNESTLSVANPDWKIFSIGIDWMDKTFKIWFFNNTALAYSTLETELQTWLWIDYEVTYVSWTNYTIKRTNWTVISLSHPNLVRTITLSWFDTISKVDVIVDWVTVQLVWATHSWSASTAITYLKSQLSTSLYYMNDDSNVLTIARKDWAIPTITKAQYNFYTYRVNYTYWDTPSSWQYHNYTNTTIDWTAYYTYGSQWRPFYWDRIVRNLWGYTENIDIWIQDSTSSVSTAGWTYITPNNQELLLTTIEKHTSSTATRCLLRKWSDVWTILSTVSFSWNVATFNYELDIWIDYYIMADNNWSTYTQTFKNNPTRGWELTNSNTSDVRNIQKVNISVLNSPTWYTKSVQFNKSSWWSDSTWTSANTALYFNQTHYLNINKTDYTAMTFSSLNHYTFPWSFPDDTAKYSLTTTNHLADITVWTLTEISITLTLSWFSYFIPCAMNIKQIEMKATSSVWVSESWIRKLWEQSCTTKYETTTAFVTDKIFKTGAWDFGNITWILTNWFLMNWTTTVSNKIDYICS